MRKVALPPHLQAAVKQLLPRVHHLRSYQESAQFVQPQSGTGGQGPTTDQGGVALQPPGNLGPHSRSQEQALPAQRLASLPARRRAASASAVPLRSPAVSGSQHPEIHLGPAAQKYRRGDDDHYSVHFSVIDVFINEISQLLQPLVNNAPTINP